MRAHLVKKGVVINTIEVPALDFMPDLIDGSVGEIVWAWNGVMLYSPQPDMAEEYQKQVAEIRAEYNAAIAQLEAMYYVKERETWPQQVTEAKAYKAYIGASTPLLDAMLSVRVNDTKEGLVGKILTNYTAYCHVVGQALATIQNQMTLLDEIL